MSRRAYLDLALIAIVWAALCLVWAVSTCEGETATSGVVRLTIFEPGGLTGYASGALVRLPTGEDGYVLSCYHNFRDGAERIGVCIDGQGCTYGTLAATDEANDLALVKITVTGCGGILVADTDPPEGATLHVWGMGPPESQKLRRSGRCIGYRSFQGPPRVGGDINVMQGNGVIVVSAPARPGDSGGPIVDSSGRLVGLVTGSDHRTESLGPCCSRIRAFLRRFCARPRPPLPGPEFVREPYADTDGVLPKWGELYPGIELPGPIPDPPTVDPTVPPTDIEIPIPDEDPEPPEEDDGELTLLLTELTVNVNQLTVNVNKMANNLDDLTSRVEQLEMGFESEEFLARVAALVKVEPGGKGEPGERGEKGPKGDQGPPGTPTATNGAAVYWDIVPKK